MNYLQRDGTGIQPVLDDEPTINNVVMSDLDDAIAQISAFDVHCDTLNLGRKYKVKAKYGSSILTYAASVETLTLVYPDITLYCTDTYSVLHVLHRHLPCSAQMLTQFCTDDYPILCRYLPGSVQTLAHSVQTSRSIWRHPFCADTLLYMETPHSVQTLTPLCMETLTPLCADTYPVLHRHLPHSVQTLTPFCGDT